MCRSRSEKKRKRVDGNTSSNLLYPVKRLGVNEEAPILLSGKNYENKLYIRNRCY